MLGRRDHPRIRGEHLRDCQTAPTSSWIIPAYAGSTTQQQTVRLDIPDHPRIRGEHTAISIAKGEAGGSSPHTRGAHIRVRDPKLSNRIIPAYAGSTSYLDCSIYFTKDHPRIRGEHQLPRLQHLFHQGSSPHTRGARLRTRRSP